MSVVGPIIHRRHTSVQFLQGCDVVTAFLAPQSFCAAWLPSRTEDRSLYATFPQCLSGRRLNQASVPITGGNELSVAKAA